MKRERISIAGMLSVFGLLCWMQVAHAWHNDFSIVNNTDTPLQFMIDTEQGGAHPDPLCRDLQAIPPQRSCHISLTDSYRFPEGTGHKGTIHLIRSDGEFCIVYYKYIFNPLASYSKKRSVELKLGQCTAGFDTKGLSFVNDQMYMSIRPLLSQLDYPLLADTLQKSTESYATADCADPSTGEESSDNCVIVTPTDPDIDKGTTLYEALAIQNTMDQYEPLSHAQWIGTHNSMIGPHYTASTKIANASHSDPNNYATLTEQLDRGVTMIEFDLLRDRGEIKLCHNHLNIPSPLNKVISKMMCDDNVTLVVGVNELKRWLIHHPEQFIIVYLDVNQSLSEHEAEIERAFSVLEPHIFMPEEASRLFFKLTGHHVLPEHTLPTDLFSKHDILKMGKQVIIVSSGEEGYLNKVKYVYLHNSHNQSDLLYQHGLRHLEPTPSLCEGSKKYEMLQAAYEDDPGHFDAWRSNGDRTVISYLSSAHGKTSSYNNYWSLASLKEMRKCPINIVSLNMFGFTCNESDVNECQYDRKGYRNRPLDPRLVSLLWSWGRGYPLKGENDANRQAFIVPTETVSAIHFQNDATSLNAANSVLCHVKSVSQETLGPKEWFIVPLKENILPSIRCEDSNGIYAVPVTSYQMDDVAQMLKETKIRIASPIWVNYRFDENAGWVANSGKALPTVKPG